MCADRAAEQRGVSATQRTVPQRGLPVEERWAALATELLIHRGQGATQNTAISLLRKQWGLIGRWLQYYHPDKSTVRWLRSWWSKTGQWLQEVKRGGEEPQHTEPEPEEQAVGGYPSRRGPDSSSSSGTRRAGAGTSSSPQINVQVHINVNNAVQSESGARERSADSVDPGSRGRSRRGGR